MEKFLLGIKQSMTQTFTDDGTVVPMTVCVAGPCVVTHVRTPHHDGTAAVEIGFGAAKRLSKPQAGHLKKLGKFRYLRQFRVADPDAWKTGTTLDVSQFSPGDRVKVSGVSKGRGFAGVVKRHHFAGSPASHGHKDQLRMPGSIGSTAPQRVFKGTRMAGQLGNRRVTVRNLEVVSIDPTKHLLMLKGAVPGSRNGMIEIIAHEPKKGI